MKHLVLIDTKANAARIMTPTILPIVLGLFIKSKPMDVIKNRINTHIRNRIALFILFVS